MRDCLRVELSFTNRIKRRIRGGYSAAMLSIEEIKKNTNCPRGLNFELLEWLSDLKIINNIQSSGSHILFYLNIYYVLALYALILFFITTSFLNYYKAGTNGMV